MPIDIRDHRIVVKGKMLRIASVQDEGVLEGVVVNDPAYFVTELRKAKVKADLFTFQEKLTSSAPRYSYPIEWDNLAVIPISTFQDWWENRLPHVTRKNVRRAERRGVVVRVEKFDDKIVEALKRIYDEAPIRQGRRFSHYGKDLKTIWEENATFLERSEYLCAYHESELIGFIRMIYFDQMASIMSIVSKNAHYDKRPMNALLALAVRTCAAKGIRYLIYGQFIYGKNKRSTLTEFKRRNGFEPIDVPTYYIPLTLRGRIAIKLKLQRGLRAILPERLVYFLMAIRTRFYSQVARRICHENSDPQPTEI